MGKPEPWPEVPREIGRMSCFLPQHLSGGEDEREALRYCSLPGQVVTSSGQLSIATHKAARLQLARPEAANLLFLFLITTIGDIMAQQHMAVRNSAQPERWPELPREIGRTNCFLPPHLSGGEDEGEGLRYCSLPGQIASSGQISIGAQGSTSPPCSTIRSRLACFS